MSILSAVDSSLKRRSLIAWVSFRTVAGLLVAIGAFAWLAVWFERDFWLGLAQTIMISLVLAHELGLLRRRSGGLH
jgi:hypothetical protein